MVIKRVVPMSAAKICGVMYGVMGLLFGAFVSLFAIGGAMFMPDENASAFGALFGVGAVLILPVFYGVLGFVMTYIAALIYNAVAGLVGGVELEVQ